MRLAQCYLASVLSFCVPMPAAAGAGGGVISGKVVLKGVPPKAKPIDLSKEPACVKMHASDPLVSESTMTGAGNTLENVVVYISAGATDNVPAPALAVDFDQRNCHYTTHVL